MYHVFLPFAVQSSLYQESANFYLLLKKNIYNSLTEVFKRWFILQGTLLTRRRGSVYLGVVVLRVCEICYVYEGYVGFAVVVYAMVLFEMRGDN